MNMTAMLNGTVQELVMASKRRVAVALALADLGITPRYASWPVAAALRDLGLNAETVELRLVAVTSGAESEPLAACPWG